MAEWSIASVLKTDELLKVPGVRIPFSPQENDICIGQGFGK